MKRFLTHTVVIASLLLWGGITCTSVRDIRVNNAKRYCDELVPLLKAYRDEHGSFPAEVSAVADLKRAPGLLKRDGGFYTQTREGESYIMACDKLDGFSGAFYRHADDRLWRHKD